MLLARITDLVVLQPTTHEIPVAAKTRCVIESSTGPFEAWIQRLGEGTEPDLFVLRFVGTGGRAECASPHPVEVWPEATAEVWAVNPPGYGTSGGRASLQQLPAIGAAAHSAIVKAAGDKPLLVVGNSLGAMTALSVASRARVDALLLRNPPPLRDLIAGHYGWWNLGFSRLLARQVPPELCSIHNASQVDAPGLFVMSGRDRTVPPEYQTRIHEAYQGESRVMLLPRADHATPVAERELHSYVESLCWLRQRMRARNEQRQQICDAT